MPSFTPAEPPRLSGPADVLDAIPYLLGFRPAGSLVLVAVDAAGHIVASARLDLVDTLSPDLTDDTVTKLHAAGARYFHAAVFDDACDPPPASGELPWSAAVVAVHEAAVRCGAVLAGATLLRHGRWWGYGCGSPAGDPPEGTELVPGTSVFAAQSAYEGVAVLPDRAALAATLTPLPGEDRAALGPAVARSENAAVSALLAGRGAAHDRAQVRQLLQAARSSSAIGWPRPDDDTVARLVVALSTIPVRDEVWMALDRRQVDGRPLWTELARRAPAPYDAAPLFLLAWGSWRAGNGALAGMAAERALAADPDYSAADLLLAALAQAVDPRRFPPLGGTDRARVRDRRRRARPVGATRTPR